MKDNVVTIGNHSCKPGESSFLFLFLFLSFFPSLFFLSFSISPCFSVTVFLLPLSVGLFLLFDLHCPSLNVISIETSHLNQRNLFWAFACIFLSPLYIILFLQFTKTSGMSPPPNLSHKFVNPLHKAHQLCLQGSESLFCRRPKAKKTTEFSIPVHLLVWVQFASFLLKTCW